MASDELYADSAQARELDKPEFALPDNDPWSPLPIDPEKEARDTARRADTQLKINALVQGIGRKWGLEK